jgi:hypothetical protein
LEAAPRRQPTALVAAARNWGRCTCPAEANNPRLERVAAVGHGKSSRGQPRSGERTGQRGDTEGFQGAASPYDSRPAEERGTIGQKIRETDEAGQAAAGTPHTVTSLAQEGRLAPQSLEKAAFPEDCTTSRDKKLAGHSDCEKGTDSSKVLAAGPPADLRILASWVARIQAEERAMHGARAEVHRAVAEKTNNCHCQDTKRSS